MGTGLLALGWHAIFWLFMVYAIGLFSVLLATIPETHPTPAKRVSVISVVRQYQAVINHRTEGRWVAMRFPLAMACSGSVLMVFVTQSAYIYMRHFEMSEQWFPMLFGANVVLLIMNNFLSMKLLDRIDPQRLFRFGMVTLLLGATTLFVGEVVAPKSLIVLLPLIAFTVGSIGLINPAGMTLYMSHFPHTGGSASAVFTTLMFALGGCLGSLPSLFLDQGLLPVVSVMLGAALTANLIAHSIPQVQLTNRMP
jgi:DHA1 family bicyclomycin/chloramphenicol resistance-like MFS transporter